MNEVVTVRDATPAERERWDTLVQAFPNHRLVHTRAWIESLRASGCGEPLYVVFERGGTIVGCLPGLVVTVGAWRLFGSPMPGWQTVSMGPVFDPHAVSTAMLLGPLVPFLETQHAVDHIELLHGGLEPDTMRTLGYEGTPVFTFRAALDAGDPERTFARFKDSARRNVRRAERLGLEVRLEHDERFVDEHYAQLCEVYHRGGFGVPFSKRRVLECFRHMRAAGRLIAPAVYRPGTDVPIATGMFFVEGKELLLWMWAHRARFRWYRATELMTWHAMLQAMSAGCETFDLMGAGDFKEKFGAHPDHSKVRWVRSRRPWLLRARRVAETGHRWQQRARGRAAQLVAWTAGRLSANGNGTAHRAAACVLGDIDLVRAVGLAGIPCAVAAPPGAASRFSRFTRTTLDWHDPWTEPDRLVDVLLRYATSQPEPPILFYGDDAALLLVSRCRERLRQAFRFVIPDADLVEALVDKARFQALAADLRLPVPDARVLQPGDDPIVSVTGLTFPLILKPTTRRPEHWDPVAGGAKALRVDTPAALRAWWPRIQAAGLVVIAQELVAGPETGVESYHAYVGANGDVVAEFTGRKIRTSPPALGDSTALEITAEEDVARLGRDVLRRLKLRGVAKLDFKRAADGQLSLLEVNPRFTLWAHPAAVAGLNLPGLVYADLVGSPRQAAAAPRAGVRWCRVWADAGAARATGVPPLHWLAWVLGCEAKRALAWDDPFPVIGAGLWRMIAGAAPRSA